MKIFLILLAVILVLFLLGFLFLFHKTGASFLDSLRKKKPGEGYNKNIDISFYLNGPLPQLSKKGIAYLETLPAEDVYVTSEDGLRLHALLIPAPEGQKKYVIGIHGFQSNGKSEFSPHLEFYRSLGFGMLLPDNRAHRESGGDFVTLGIKDRRDALCWVRYLAGRFGEDTKVLLHGVSMGGATVLNVSGEDDLPLQVAGIISDCGFTDAKESFACQIRAIYHIDPTFPLWVCGWYTKHKAGFDMTEVSPIDQVKKARVPVLFVQGEEDMMVPAEMAKQLYAACGAPKKKLLLVPKANHAESVAYDPEGYHAAIKELFGL